MRLVRGRARRGLLLGVSARPACLRGVRGVARRFAPGGPRGLCARAERCSGCARLRGGCFRPARAGVCAPRAARVYRGGGAACARPGPCGPYRRARARGRSGQGGRRGGPACRPGVRRAGALSGRTRRACRLFAHGWFCRVRDRSPVHRARVGRRAHEGVERGLVEPRGMVAGPGADRLALFAAVRCADLRCAPIRQEDP